MDFNLDTCTHCGYTELLCLDEAVEGGVVSEANYFCGKCFRHLAFYGYGYTRAGSGQLPDEAQRKRLRTQLDRVEESEQHRYFMELHAKELHEVSGYPLEQCTAALYAQRGSHDQALAQLIAGQTFPQGGATLPF